MDALDVQVLLKKHVSESLQERKAIFFKTGPGEYAEHDRFLGLTVPTVRKVFKQCVHLSLKEIGVLLASAYNEERLLALFILVQQYKKADTVRKQEIYQFYLDNIEFVSNWNLVDSSAHLIMGAHIFCYDLNRSVLIEYAQSRNLWERRIAIIATWYFIKKLDFVSTFAIAKMLLSDKHDLIHKAVGWMLREVGNKDVATLKLFLDEHACVMPRTMLRYAIEKLPQDDRLMYLKRKA